MKITRGTALALAMLLSLPLGALQAAPADDIRELAATSTRLQHHDSPYDERDWLDRFYGKQAYAPVWRPATARAALALLNDAPSHGLSSADYNVEGLAAAIGGAALAPATDVALTQSMLHYLADLKVGRVRSEYHTTLPDPRLAAFDPVEQLRTALAQNQLASAVKAAQPGVFLYQKVREVLANYRALAKLPETALPTLPPKTKVTQGDAYASADLLRARLVLLGDLAAEAPAPAPEKIYSANLAEGVRHFQARHGLADDGVLGPGTIAALNLPLRVRVRQLELTLERLRWLPDFGAGPIIAVNLPTFRLWAFQLGGAEDAPLEMRVIVGTAVKHETPLFIGSMSYVEFNPYWNVPRSIERAEIIPKMKAKATYLVDNQMELVPKDGAAPIQTINATTLQGLQEGKYRVRQRPGPSNALGAVKFAMPNPDNIYLHSTSARELFKRTRRDLSHGCIRVEKPLELAQFVLAGHPTMRAEDIAAAMEPGPMRVANIKPPIPVVLFYATAITDQSGKALFAQDIYERDPALEAALTGRYSKVKQPKR